MIQHHPTDNLLVEFAAGTLDKAQALAINGHLHFCTKCQQNIK
jgi:putative transcriptional regulator